MSIFAAPGATFTATLEDAAAGLAGTLGVRIENADGSNHTARTTAGIVELEPASGAYAKANLTAPTTAGTYVVLWDTGGASPVFAGEDLVVTSTAPTASVPAGSDLTTLGAVRSYLQKAGSEIAQDSVLQSLITRASLAIIRFTDREFAPLTAALTRKFVWRPTQAGYLNLAPYDLRSLTGGFIKIDSDTPSPATLTQDQFRLYPRNAPNGVFTEIRLDYNTGSVTWGEREVEVKGDWGFPAVPADVEHLCIVQVALWLRRDVAAFEATFSLDEERLERPRGLASAVQDGLAPYKRVPV